MAALCRGVYELTMWDEVRAVWVLGLVRWDVVLCCVVLRASDRRQPDNGD